MRRIADRYVWDKHPGYFYIEWWEGKKRRREMAGQTPSEASEAQRRKANELLGELISGGNHIPNVEEGTATPITDDIALFMGISACILPASLRPYGAIKKRIFGHP
jgi:hypothetical protein